jgi:hypothetical protein
MSEPYRELADQARGLALRAAIHIRLGDYRVAALQITMAQRLATQAADERDVALGASPASIVRDQLAASVASLTQSKEPT